MHGFRVFVGVFGVSGIADTQCGFKLFTRAAAQHIFPNVRLNGWIFDVELLVLAKHFGVVCEEIRVNWAEMSGSKLSLAVDSIGMAVDLLLMRIAYSSGIWPIHAPPC